MSRQPCSKLYEFHSKVTHFLHEMDPHRRKIGTIHIHSVQAPLHVSGIDVARQSSDLFCCPKVTRVPRTGLVPVQECYFVKVKGPVFFWIFCKIFLFLKKRQCLPVLPGACYPGTVVSVALQLHGDSKKLWNSLVLQRRS